MSSDRPKNSIDKPPHTTKTDKGPAPKGVDTPPHTTKTDKGPADIQTSLSNWASKHHLEVKMSAEGRLSVDVDFKCGNDVASGHVTASDGGACSTLPKIDQLPADSPLQSAVSGLLDQLNNSQDIAKFSADLDKGTIGCEVTLPGLGELSSLFDKLVKITEQAVQLWIDASTALLDRIGSMATASEAQGQQGGSSTAESGASPAASSQGSQRSTQPQDQPGMSGLSSRLADDAAQAVGSLTKKAVADVTQAVLGEVSNAINEMTRAAASPEAAK